MKQTAVDYLFSELWDVPKDKLTWYYTLMKADAMEKEQIKEAYKCGACDLEIQYSDVGEINSEKYYQETYGKDARHNNVQGD
jgi:membrane-bound inhibitor of C-type lysozyme